MILVTGGSGLLGTHLLYKLVSNGHAVRALRRESTSLENILRIFCWNNPSGESLFDRIEWVEGDILDIGSLTEAIEGVTEVFHCAALVSMDSSDRKRMQRVNRQGTANMVNVALDAGVNWFCHVSSIAALGSPEGNAYVDEASPWNTDARHSDYSMTKFAAEREMWRAMEEGLKGVIVNPSVILGPGPGSKGSCLFYKALDKGLKYYPSGTNGFVDVRDVVDVMFRLLEEKVVGERYIISGGNHSYHDLFSAMSRLIGKTGPSIQIPGSILRRLWIFDLIRSAMTGQSMVLTRESARIATESTYYSAERVQQALDFRFRPLEETLAYLKSFCFDEAGNYQPGSIVR